MSALLMLAVLCGLVRWTGDGGRGWVLAGGAASGLALLTKVPAVYPVLYHRQTQIRRWPGVLNTSSRRRPDHVVRLNGVEYARICRPQPSSGRQA